MITLDIPGREAPLVIEHLVLDVNGTIARDGEVLPNVAEEVAALVGSGVHVVAITADTHGTAPTLRETLGVDIKVIEPGAEEQQKASYVRWLGAQRVAAIGNGANDTGMLAAAAVGICVIGPEGAAGSAVTSADVVVGDIGTALGLLRAPARLIATLRR